MNEIISISTAQILKNLKQTQLNLETGGKTDGIHLFHMTCFIWIQ
jgi:hypothetical protein